MEEMIRTEELTKVYDGRTILDRVSLKVNQGEIYGFLGLNGAGKTTTIRMLLGMIKPTSGQVYLHGRRLTPGGDLWNQVGYMVEVPYAYPDLTVRENLILYAQMRGIRRARNAVNDAVDQLSLSAYIDTKVKNLSLGNAQKLGIAKAVIHQPRILILDEPINALDPAGIVAIRELLKSLADKGVTVFISSHILEEMSKLASRIGIIHQGVLLQEISVREFEDLRAKKLYLGVRGNPELAKQKLTEAGFHAKVSAEQILELSNPGAVQRPELINQIMAKAGIPVYLLRVEEEELESYFLHMVGSDLAKELK